MNLKKSLKKSWWKPLALAPLAIAPVATITSCSLIQNFFQQQEAAVKQKGFGIWDNQMLDFASNDFWNREDVKTATKNQFQIWKDLAANGQSVRATMETKVHFLDVGQADATLIEVLPKAGLSGLDKINNSFNILIDSGDFKSGTTDDKTIYTPFYQTKLEPTLKKHLNNGQDKIDLFMFSHAHGDHIGQASLAINQFAKKGQSIVVNWGDIKQNSAGFKKLIASTIKNQLVYLDPFVDQAINVEQLVDDKQNLNPESVFSQFLDQNDQAAKLYGVLETNNDLKSWKANGQKLFSLTPGANIINFAPDNFFAYLAPTKDYEPNRPNKSPNENSINAMFKITNDQANYRMIFTGDAEGHTHQDLLDAIKGQTRFQNQDSQNIYAVDLYKVAHHGSTTENSNNAAFLANILKANTKMIIQANDNKTFSGSPTLREQFFKNLDLVVNNPASGLGHQDLDQSVMITQNLGDINFTFDNTKDLKNPTIELINRILQKDQGWLKLKTGEKITTNPASKYKPSETSDKYEHYLYQPKNS